MLKLGKYYQIKCESQKKFGLGLSFKTVV